MSEVHELHHPEHQGQQPESYNRVPSNEKARQVHAAVNHGFADLLLQFSDRRLELARRWRRGIDLNHTRALPLRGDGREIGDVRH